MGLKHPLWLQGGGRIRCGGWKHSGHGDAVVQRRDDDMRTLMAAMAQGGEHGKYYLDRSVRTCLIISCNAWEKQESRRTVLHF